MAHGGRKPREIWLAHVHLEMALKGEVMVVKASHGITDWTFLGSL